MSNEPQHFILSKEASAWKGFHKSAELSNIFNSFQNFWKPPLTLNQLHQHRGPCEGEISFDIPLELILPGLNILWYSTWHWYWNYEAILGLDIFWCSSNDFDDLCRSPLTAKLSRDIFVTTTFPLFSDNLPELPLVHMYISTLVYFPEIWVVKYRWSMLRMLGF